MSRSRRTFYGEEPAPADTGPGRPGLDLAGAGSLAGLKEEIKLLRALVKQAVQLKRGEEARRLLMTLCSALRLEHALDNGPAAEQTQALQKLLDDTARDLLQAATGPDTAP